MFNTNLPGDKSALTWALQLENTAAVISSHAHNAAAAAQRMNAKAACLDTRPNFEMRAETEMRAAEIALSLAIDDLRAAMAALAALPNGTTYMEGAPYMEAAE
jgi:hypothetical protein